MLDEIRESQDMGHSLCRNLCEGWWPMDYTIHRLVIRSETRDVGQLP